MPLPQLSAAHQQIKATNSNCLSKSFLFTLSTKLHRRLCDLDLKSSSLSTRLSIISHLYFTSPSTDFRKFILLIAFKMTRFYRVNLGQILKIALLGISATLDHSKFKNIINYQRFKLISNSISFLCLKRTS